MVYDSLSRARAYISSKMRCYVCYWHYWGICFHFLEMHKYAIPAVPLFEKIRTPFEKIRTPFSKKLALFQEKRPFRPNYPFVLHKHACFCINIQFGTYRKLFYLFQTGARSHYRSATGNATEKKEEDNKPVGAP